MPLLPFKAFSATLSETGKSESSDFGHMPALCKNGALLLESIPSSLAALARIIIACASEAYGLYSRFTENASAALKATEGSSLTVSARLDRLPSVLTHTTQAHAAGNPLRHLLATRKVTAAFLSQVCSELISASQKLTNDSSSGVGPLVSFVGVYAAAVKGWAQRCAYAAHLAEGGEQPSVLTAPLRAELSSLPWCSNSKPKAKAGACCCSSSADYNEGIHRPAGCSGDNCLLVQRLKDGDTGFPLIDSVIASISISSSSTSSSNSTFFFPPTVFLPLLATYWCKYLGLGFQSFVDYYASLSTATATSDDHKAAVAMDVQWHLGLLPASLSSVDEAAAGATAAPVERMDVFGGFCTQGEWQQVVPHGKNSYSHPLFDPAVVASFAGGAGSTPSKTVDYTREWEREFVERCRLLLAWPRFSPFVVPHPHAMCLPSASAEEWASPAVDAGLAFSSTAANAKKGKLSSTAAAPISVANARELALAAVMAAGRAHFSPIATAAGAAHAKKPKEDGGFLSSLWGSKKSSSALESDRKERQEDELTPGQLLSKAMLKAALAHARSFSTPSSSSSGNAPVDAALIASLLQVQADSGYDACWGTLPHLPKVVTKDPHYSNKESAGAVAAGGDVAAAASIMLGCPVLVEEDCEILMASTSSSPSTASTDGSSSSSSSSSWECIVDERAAPPAHLAVYMQSRSDSSIRTVMANAEVPSPATTRQGYDALVRLRKYLRMDKSWTRIDPIESRCPVAIVPPMPSAAAAHATDSDDASAGVGGAGAIAIGPPSHSSSSPSPSFCQSLDLFNRCYVFLADVPPPPYHLLITPRYFTMVLNSYLDPRTGRGCVYLRNASHHLEPAQPGLIRGESLGCVGFVVQPLPSAKSSPSASPTAGAWDVPGDEEAADRKGGLRITLMTAADPKGSIPSGLINFVARRTPRLWIDRFAMGIAKFRDEDQKGVFGKGKI